MITESIDATPTTAHNGFAPQPAGPAGYRGRLTRVLLTVSLLICLGVGLTVRWVGLSERSLWFDEAYTLRMAEYPASEILARVRHDNNPPLYYLLARCWVQAFGSSPAAFRSLSVVSGLAVIAGLFLFTRALLSGPLAEPGRISRREALWVPMLAAAFVALNALQVRYSWEGRMYAFGSALAAFSGWALVRAMDSARPRWGWWLLFGAITTLFAYVHTFALLTIAAEAGFVAWWLFERCGGSPRRVVRDTAFWPAVTGFGLVAVGFGVWLPTLYAQFSVPHTRQWIPALTSVTQLYLLCDHLFIDPFYSPAPGEAPMGATWAVAGAAGLLAVTLRRGRWVDGCTLALGLGPILLAVAACLAGVQVLVDRYFLFAQPFLLCVLAIGVARVRHPGWFALAVVTLLTAHGYCCHDHWQRTALDKHPGYRGAAEYISGDRQPGDVVLCCDGNSYLPIYYHLPDRTDLYAVTHPGGWLAGQWVLDTRREAVHPKNLDERFHGRVWVVNRVEALSPPLPVPVPPSWQVQSSETFQEAFDAETITVLLYITPPASGSEHGR
jgi:hypothetical protein